MATLKTEDTSSMNKLESRNSSQDDESLKVDAAFERSTIRKIDRRLLLILGGLYAASLIDRINISIARVAGMGVDLQLQVGDRYSVATLIFFVGYIIFEYPSNSILRRVGCRVWLSGICLAFGLITIGMAFVQNWQQLVFCRALLGIAEAGYFPGCVFLISTWYTRFETQKRLAVFYISSMTISAFANIIGYGISKLAGAGGLAGWRWIFLIFGIATVVLSIAAYYLIVDFPDQQTFLTLDQTKWVLDRIEADRGDSKPDVVSKFDTLKYLLDPKLWVFGILFGCSTMPAYAFAYFLPIILGGGGFSVEASLLLSAPPYLIAAVYVFGSAYLSDRYRMRAAFIAINALFCTVGLLILGLASSIGVRYAGAFLSIAGANANVPGVLSLQANNVLGHSKRALASALVIGFGGIGGIVASVVFAQKDFPRYLPGLYVTIGAQCLILVLLAGFSYHSVRMNKMVDEGTAVIEGRVGFKYTI